MVKSAKIASRITVPKIPNSAYSMVDSAPVAFGCSIAAVVAGARPSGFDLVKRVGRKAGTEAIDGGLRCDAAPCIANAMRAGKPLEATAPQHEKNIVPIPPNASARHGGGCRRLAADRSRRRFPGIQR